MRMVLSLVCLLGSLGCLLVFFSFRSETKEENNTKNNTWAMGFSPSPWLVFKNEEQTIEEIQGGVKVATTRRFMESRKVVYLSASWLFLLGAIVSWMAFRRLWPGSATA